MPRKRDGDLTRVTLVREVARATGVSQKTVNEVLLATFTTIARTVVAGNSVSITNFGTFIQAVRSGGQGWNPHTRSPIEVPDMKRMHLRMAPAMKRHLQKDDPSAVTIEKKRR